MTMFNPRGHLIAHLLSPSIPLSLFLSLSPPLSDFIRSPLVFLLRRQVEGGETGRSRWMGTGGGKGGKKKNKNCHWEEERDCEAKRHWKKFGLKKADNMLGVYKSTARSSNCIA